MGAEAACRATFGSERGEGKALLETDALVFRGAFRLKIPLKDVRSVAANEGNLVVAWPGGTATFELGARAAAWAGKIAKPKTRVEKMGVKAGDRVSVIGVTEAAFARELETAGADVSTRARKGSDAIFVQVDAREALARAVLLKDHVALAGGLWVVHPKGRADLKDVDVMAALRKAGLVDNKVVGFSDTHSALRFVVPRKDR